MGKVQVKRPLEKSPWNRVYFLGSEYNSERVDGESRSMQEQVHDFLEDGENSNSRYFTILKAQLDALHLLNSDSRQYPTTKVLYSDVSLVPAGGRHSADDVYRRNVADSVERHRAILSEFKPELVVVGGKSAYREFCLQVIQGLPQEIVPPLILRMANPSPQSHRGSTEAWVQRYSTLRDSGILTRRLGTPSISVRAELIWKRSAHIWNVIYFVIGSEG